MPANGDGPAAEPAAAREAGEAQEAGEGGEGEHESAAGQPAEHDLAGRRRLLARLAVPAGLCAACVHLRLLASSRSVFVRCGLAATDPAFPRYPALPVIRCAGYRPLPPPPE